MNMYVKQIIYKNHITMYPYFTFMHKEYYIINVYKMHFIIVILPFIHIKLTYKAFRQY